MAINPTPSFSNAASLLQDVNNLQKKNTEKSINITKDAQKNSFQNVVEQQIAEKSTSVSSQLQAQEADKSSLKVDIKIGDEDRADKKKINLSQSFNREAPISNAYQNQRPGSNLDISV